MVTKYGAILDIRVSLLQNNACILQITVETATDAIVFKIANNGDVNDDLIYSMDNHGIWDNIIQQMHKSCRLYKNRMNHLVCGLDTSC